MKSLNLKIQKKVNHNLNASGFIVFVLFIAYQYSNFRWKVSYIDLRAVIIPDKSKFSHDFFSSIFKC